MSSNGEHLNIMVFRPTMDEFKNFNKYIQYIESQNAQQFGIAKIIPPSGWIPRQRNYMEKDILKMKIPNPITQHVVHIGEAFLQNNLKRESMTVSKYLKLSESAQYKTPPSTSHEDLENQFWNTFMHNPPIYGADILKTLFDSKCEIWNMNKMSSILDLLKDSCGVEIDGINSPYLYIGMWRTIFPWHLEDMDLYSINYLHTGSPKTWYAISPEHGSKFEQLVSILYSNYFKMCPAFYRHKMCILSPETLDKWSIPWNKITQESGEIIITFPFAYHTGFNHGFNIAESINFATLRWLDYGKRALLCKCRTDMVEFDMDPFIKLYQPEQYPLWLKEDEYGFYPKETSQMTIGLPDSIEINRNRTTERSENMPNVSTFLTNQTDRVIRALPSIQNPDEINEHDSNNMDVDSGACCSKVLSEHEKFNIVKKPGHGNNGIFINYIDNLLEKNVVLEIRRFFNLFVASKKPHCFLCMMLFYDKADFRDDWKIEARSLSKFALVPLPKLTETLFKCAISGNYKYAKSELVRCAICYLTVHKVCYGTALNKGCGQHWLCNMCQTNSLVTECAYCPINVGALKKNSAGFLSHIECSLFVKCSRLKNSILLSVDNLIGSQCIVCGLSEGNRFRCTDENVCGSWFHISCGILAGFEYYLNLREKRKPKVFIRCHIHQHNIYNSKPSLYIHQKLWVFRDNRKIITAGLIKNIENRPYCMVKLNNDVISTDTLMDQIKNYWYGSLTPHSKVKLQNGNKGEFLGVNYKPYYLVEFTNGRTEWVTQEDIYCTDQNITSLQCVEEKGLNKIYD